jgi:Dolichol-phosphate mannosyltransferase subunit 3 (DPM3)
MALLRYQVFLSYSVAFLATWLFVLYNQNNDDVVCNSSYNKILIVGAPLWALVGLGIYLLCLLIHGVLNYQDCPEAAKELEHETVEAKAEMKKRGIIK